MSPKNAIKMINIQKYYLVHVGPFCPLWFYSIHIVLFGLSPIQSTLVLFGPICSYSVHIGPLYPIQFTLVLFSPPYSHLVLFLSIQSTFFHLVHLCSLRSIQTTSIHLCSLQSNFVHLHIGRRHVQVESTDSKCKYIYIYICMYISNS